jgi:hypothetical protein
MVRILSSIDPFGQTVICHSVEAMHFQLYKRAKHVQSEALRVLQFRDICFANNGRM